MSKIIHWGKECELIYQNPDFSLLCGTWLGVTQFAVAENTVNESGSIIPSAEHYIVIRDYADFVKAVNAGQDFMRVNNLRTMDQFTNTELVDLIFPGKKL